MKKATKRRNLQFVALSAHEGTRTPTVVDHCHLKTARLPLRHMRILFSLEITKVINSSEKRGSNPRLRLWKGRVLPIMLFFASRCHKINIFLIHLYFI